MSNQSFADELDAATQRLASMPREELQTLLRRAALRLRNTKGMFIDPDVDDMLGSIAGEMQMIKSDLIRRILREWLEANAYLPVHMLEEDGPTEGSA